MSDWKVSVEEIEVFPHPNADKMELARVGTHGLVVAKDQYKTGEKVIFAPKRSVVPKYLRDCYENDQTGESYLKGGHTVKSVRLRGELSEGVVIPFKRVRHILGVGSIDDLVLEEDISERLGFEEFTVYIPPQYVGTWATTKATKYSRHDVENIRLYTKEFTEGELVYGTAKVHGCKIYETLVDTFEYGKLQIGQIVEEKLDVHVKSFNVDTQEIEWKSIENYFQMEKTDDWYELELEDGRTITITGEDRIWLPEFQCYRHVRDLEEGDTFLVDFN